MSHTTRIADIITRVRDTLSDPNADRWSDARLIRLVDEAQKDIAKKSLLLRERIGFSILAGINAYELSENTIHFMRFVNDKGEELEVITHEQMDKLDTDWEIRVGPKVERIVYDKLNPRQFKVYPIPSSAFDGATETFLIGDFGVVSIVEGDATSDFGVVGSVSNTALLTSSFTSPFGITTGMSSVEQALTVYYYRYPNTVTQLTDQLEIDYVYDIAIKNYVIGEAFIDDKDTQDVGLGQDKRQQYHLERIEAAKDSSLDFNRASRRETKFTTGFGSNDRSDVLRRRHNNGDHHG